MNIGTEVKKLPSIILVGPMGSGKTTIGKLLANILKREFIDIDWYIEDVTGADIPWIFEKEGEEGFRERESKAVDELTDRQNLVIATGGGVVMRKENRKILKERGVVVYLNADVRVQMQRTKSSKNRPLLHTDNPEQVLKELYKIRDPWYREVADVEVISGKLYPKKMVFEVISAIESLGYYIQKDK